MAGITTHILDVSGGIPAAGVRVELYRQSGEAWKLVRELVTNVDGRTDEPILKPEETAIAVYELRFHIGDYFADEDNADDKVGDDVPFLDIVPVRFSISELTRHYHVPLLVAPWSYTTYRGS
ncbi:MAG: hydroxyisourate hydrolase [Rhizobiales bacterium]|nr:hydroxyisourate hydrolase [Hyphomicrobiales bacterium]